MSIEIHGKQYITVAERLQLLHASTKPFEIVESAPVQMGDKWVWRCTVLIDGKRYMGSAEVHFNAKPGSADATDPMACAETSAIGRALGFAGYGAIESIASADEIVRNDQPTPSLTEIKDAVKSLGLARNPEMWANWKKQVLGRAIPDDRLTPAQLAKMKEKLLAA